MKQSKATELRDEMNIALSKIDPKVNIGNLQIHMSQQLAGTISSMTNMLDSKQFPNITPNGGTLLGYPVIVSNDLPEDVVSIYAPFSRSVVTFKFSPNKGNHSNDQANDLVHRPAKSVSKTRSKKARRVHR